MIGTRNYTSLWGSPKLCNNSNHIIFSVFRKNLQEDLRILPFSASQLLILIFFTPVKGNYTVRHAEELPQSKEGLSLTPATHQKQQLPADKKMGAPMSVAIQGSIYMNMTA